jgi:hypothetical protein
MLSLSTCIEGYTEGGISAWNLTSEEWNLVLNPLVSMSYDVVMIA